MQKSSLITFLCLTFVLSVYSSECTIWLYSSKFKGVYDEAKGFGLTFSSLSQFEIICDENPEVPNEEPPHEELPCEKYPHDELPCVKYPDVETPTESIPVENPPYGEEAGFPTEEVIWHREIPIVESEETIAETWPVYEVVVENPAEIWFSETVLEEVVIEIESVFLGN